MQDLTSAMTTRGSAPFFAPLPHYNLNQKRSFSSPEPMSSTSRQRSAQMEAQLIASPFTENGIIQPHPPRSRHDSTTAQSPLPPLPSGARVEGKRKTTTPPCCLNSIRSGWASESIATKAMVPALIVQAFATGILDATTYADFNTFASNRMSSFS